MHIGVLFGGKSVEHEISIITGMQVLKNINTSKYKVTPIYLTKNNEFLIGKNYNTIETFKKPVKGKKVYFKKGKIGNIFFKKIDCIVNCVHGKNVEGGEVAGFFNILGIPNTSIDVLGASICQDKAIIKTILEKEKIPVVPYTTILKKDYRDNKEKVLTILKNISYPLIIKPSTLGSSIGIKTVKDEMELLNAINYAFRYDDKLIVEKKLEKIREFNCAIINDNEISLIEEISFKDEIFTFSDKYESKESKRIIPADIPIELEKLIYDYTLKTAKIINNKGVIRIDYLYDNNTLFVNEVNTIPGALAYYLFEPKNIFFDSLIDKLITNAIYDHYTKNQKLNVFESNVLNMRGIKK